MDSDLASLRAPADRESSAASEHKTTEYMTFIANTAVPLLPCLLKMVMFTSLDQPKPVVRALCINIESG